MTDSDYGVIDAVQVTNPEAREHTGKREIESLMSKQDRQKNYDLYREKFPDQFDTVWIDQKKRGWVTYEHGKCEVGEMKK